jgi:hypothetical protein
MKKFIIITLVALISKTALAENQTLANIARVANSSEVQKFIEENRLQVESVNRTEFKTPIEGHSYLVVKAKDTAGRTCEVWVMAGLCSSVDTTQCNPEKITILTEKSYIKCE